MLKNIYKSSFEELEIGVIRKEKNFQTLEYITANEDAFKDALKNNKHCRVLRKTFVVEHDEEKNKVIFKKYFVRKESNEIKNLNKLYLKTHKTYKSLSIDIATGEFSVFKTETTKRSEVPKIFIRKTVFNKKVYSIIDSIFESCTFIKEKDITEGINKSLLLLGYDKPITELIDKNFLKLIYCNYYDQIDLTSYFKVFIAINYFDKLGIVINKDQSILFHAENFRIKKKNYSNKTIYDYYSDYLGIDKTYIKNAIEYKNELNLNVYEINKNIINTKNIDNKIFYKEQEYFSLNEVFLKIIYKLDYTFDDIKNNKEIFNLVYNNIFLFKESFLFKADDLPFDILIENKQFFKNIINNDELSIVTFNDIESKQIVIKSVLKNMRILRDIYGIKIDPAVFYNKPFNNILKALYDSVEETGIYTVSKKFLNILKKQLPKNTKCYVSKNIDKIFYEQGFENEINSTYFNFANAVLIISNKKETIKLTVSEDNINIFTKNSNSNLLVKSCSNFVSNFYKKINKLEYVGLKAHFSKKVFEKFLKKRYSEKDYNLIIKNLVYLR